MAIQFKKVRRLATTTAVLTAGLTLSPIVTRPAAAAFKYANIMYPLRYPITAQVEDGVGPPRGDHEGYDFFPGGSLGHKVFASHAGTVSVSGANICGGPISGLTVSINHGTYRTNYFHLSSYAAGLGNGTVVASGQLIAFEGQSGDACGGHHLHWEVRDNADGVPINFNSWIRTAYNACPYGQSCLPTAPWVTAFAPISFRGEWYFTEGPDPSSEKRVMFGEPGDIPLMGDWNGDLYDTPGVVRFNPVTGNLRWYLHNKQIPLTYWGEPLGVAQGTWDWGTRNDYPINGDWVYSGTGPDGPGIVRKNTPPSTPEWWLSVPYAPYYLLFGYGADFDSPMIGDWYCASGTFDTPGVTRASSASGGSLRWLLSHGFPAAPAHDFTWGDYTDRPLAGRSVSSGLCTTPVIHRQETSSWFLNYGFDSSTEASFGFGDVNSYGLVADWDLDSYDEYVVAV